jgi:hypothetical protein
MLDWRILLKLWSISQIKCSIFKRESSTCVLYGIPHAAPRFQWMSVYYTSGNFRTCSIYRVVGPAILFPNLQSTISCNKRCDFRLCASLAVWTNNYILITVQGICLWTTWFRIFWHCGRDVALLEVGVVFISSGRQRFLWKIPDCQ